MSRKFNFKGGLEQAGLPDDARLPVENPEYADADAIVSANDVEKADATVNEHFQEIEAVREEAEGLEAIAAMIESTLGSRGLDNKSAMFAHHAVTTHTKRIGMRNPMPSVENFGAITSQMATTRLGLEDLKSVIGDAWKWLIDLLKKGMRKISEYYNRVWAQAPKLIAKAEKIKKMASDVKTGKKSDGDKVEVSSGLMKIMHVNKAFPANLTTALNDISEIGGDIFVDYVQKVTTWGAAAVEKTGSIDYAKDDSFVKTVTDLMASSLPEDLFAKASNEVTEGPMKGAKRTSEIMGGRAVYFRFGPPAATTATEDAGEGADKGADKAANEGGKEGAAEGATVDWDTYSTYANNAQGTRVWLGAFQEKEPELNDVTIATMDTGSISTVAEKTIELCTIIMNYKVGNKTANDLREKAVKAAERAQTNSLKADALNKGNAKVASSLHKVLSAVNDLLTQPNQNFCNYMLKVADASLQLCEKSLTNYK